MAFCIRFPKLSNSAVQQELVVVGKDVKPVSRDLSSIVVRVTDTRTVGRWDDLQTGVVAFVSGNLTSVPSSFAAGAGSVAARLLGTLYVENSVAAFSLVDGSFCAAIVDRARRKIILGRDKLGTARAYISRQRDFVTFSDSMSDLLDLEQRKFDIDLDSVYAFLSIGWVPTPNSMFREIEKLPPGTYVESTGGQLTDTTYYDIPHVPSMIKHRASNDVSAQVAEHLDRSVDRGFALGGRWGSFLSGGVDSSSVVSSMARRQPSDLPTYFGGFSTDLNRYLPNPEEPIMSQLVARCFHTDHHMLWLGPEAVNDVSEIVGVLEEPVCDGGCIIVAAVMRAAQSDIDGLMTGIAGDFLFTGERRHMVLNLLRYMRPVPAPVWSGVQWLLGRSLIASNARISQIRFDLTRLLGLRTSSIEAMYAGFYLQAEPHELCELFLEKVRSELARSPFAEMETYFDNCADLDPLSRFLYLDLKTQSHEHCVREVETLGRHFGLTAYNPFLDSQFVDFAMSIPASEKVSGLSLKIPLKKAMRGRVPDEVLDRKKGGLGSPIRWWVTQSEGLVSEKLSRHNVERRGLFSFDTIEKFREATASGAHDYSKLLWSLFTLELWFQCFVDQRA